MLSPSTFQDLVIVTASFELRMDTLSIMTSYFNTREYD